jgi:hypothetical protein
VLTCQDGLALPSMEEQREHGILRVQDAMRPAEDPVLDAEEILDRVLQRVDGKPAHVMLVRSNPSGWSSVSRHELEIMVREGKGQAYARFCSGYPPDRVLAS